MNQYAQSYRTLRAQRDYRRARISELVNFSLRWFRCHCSGYLSGALLSLCIISVFSFTPSLFMKHSYEQNGVKLLSDVKLLDNSYKVLGAVNERIAASELYRPDMKFKVYLCNKRWVYFLASSFSLSSKGVYVTTTGRIAIDMTRIKGKNDLVHCITHEITHDMVQKHLGWRVLTTPKWVSEGYAEYVAQRSWSYCDVKENLAQIRTGNIDPDDYGLYWLLVSYALDVNNMPLVELFRKPFATAEIISAMQTQSVASLLDSLIEKNYDGYRSSKALNMDRETAILDSCPG